MSEVRKRSVSLTAVCTQQRQSSINSLVAILSCPILRLPQATRTQWKPWEMNRDTVRERAREKTRMSETKRDFPSCSSSVAAVGNEGGNTDEP